MELERSEDLTQKLESLLPHAPPVTHLWTILIRHMHDNMAHVLSKATCESQALQSGQARKDLLRKISKGTHTLDGQIIRAVSGWVEQGWRSETSSWNIPGELPERKSQPSKTVDEICRDLHIGQWEFDAHKCSEACDILQVVGSVFLSRFAVLQKERLRCFLERLEAAYVPTNAYHTAVHAADMCNSFWCLVHKSGMLKREDNSSTAWMAALIAGLAHDVGHFGKNNLFLTSSRHQLAITYNERSVLENYHACVLQRLLDQEYGEGVDQAGKLLDQLSAAQLREARNRMITLILGTDHSQLLGDLSAFRVRIGAAGFNPLEEPNDQHMTLGMFFRGADTGHSGKTWHLHEAWSFRVTQEFHQQGDEEKELGLAVSPLCDRANFDMASSQVGFLKFLCFPLWKELANVERRVKDLEAPSHALKEGSRDSIRIQHFQSALEHGSTGAGASQESLVRQTQTWSQPWVKRLCSETSPPRTNRQPVWIEENCMAFCQENMARWKERSA